MNKDIKAIVFDWDGTLFDSMEYKITNYIELMAKHGVDRKKALDAHHQLTGRSRRQIFTSALDRALSDDEFLRLSLEYTKANVEASKQAKLFPDAIEFLEQQFAKYIFVVSSSAAAAEVQHVVMNTPQKSYFKLVLGSDGSFEKGPSHIAFICKELGLLKEGLVFVGDDLQDMVLATEAKVSGIRVCRHRHMPSTEITYKVVSSLLELEDIL
jgi:phosphoglycolate phosphatase-like HAD superfamily hydrolase